MPRAATARFLPPRIDRPKVRIDPILPAARREVIYDPWADEAIPRRQAEDGWPTPHFSPHGRPKDLHYYEQLDLALRQRQAKALPTFYQEFLWCDRYRHPRDELEGGGIWLAGRTWPIDAEEFIPLPPPDSFILGRTHPERQLDEWLLCWDELAPWEPIGEEAPYDTCVLVVPKRPYGNCPFTMLSEFNLALQAIGDEVYAAKAYSYGRIGCIRMRGWITSGLVPTRRGGDWDHVR